MDKITQATETNVNSTELPSLTVDQLKNFPKRVVIVDPIKWHFDEATAEWIQYQI